MSFAAVLQDTLNRLTLASEDRQSYTKDAEMIRDYIIQRMKEKDEDFKKCFKGCSLTGSYLDGLKIDKPDEFDIHIVLQLPYKITVREMAHPQGCLQLCFQESYNRPMNVNITEGNSISREKLQAWIRGILASVIDPVLNLLLSSNRTYRIQYSDRLRGYAIAHTISVVDIDDKNREISFDFVPAFEFGKADWVSKKPYNYPNLSWFAVPSHKNEPLPFMICATHLEHEMIKDKQNLKNSLRLLKAIRDHNDMSHLTSYLIKTVYLWEIESHSDAFWEQPMGYLLLYMVYKLYESLRTGSINFFWNSEVNLLERLNQHEIRDFMDKMLSIYQKLNSCRNGGHGEGLQGIFS